MNFICCENNIVSEYISSGSFSDFNQPVEIGIIKMKNEYQFRFQNRIFFPRRRGMKENEPHNLNEKWDNVSVLKVRQ